MSWCEVGQRLSGTIASHEIRMFGDKMAVVMVIEVPDPMTAQMNAKPHEIHARIYMTPRSANLARAQLKACGFDPDAQELWLLSDDPYLLAGKPVQVDVEDWGGKMAFKISTSAISRDQVSEMQAAIRAAKKRK